MGFVANLEVQRETINTSNDEIVIRHYNRGIVGGRSLDLSNSGITDSVIKAGHVIIKNTQTDVYMPMPVSEGAYASLPSNCVYVGVLRGTIPASEPFAAIMYDGEVNDIAVPYSIDGIATALKAALPKLTFMHD